VILAPPAAWQIYRFRSGERQRAAAPGMSAFSRSYKEREALNPTRVATASPGFLPTKALPAPNQS
jgi:hypothetical protein